MADINTLIRKLSHDPDDLVEDQNTPVFLPIVTSARLWLPKLGIGDDARFADIFRQTWRRIMLRDRRRIVRHWREGSRYFPIQGHWSPLIMLSNDWQFSDRGFREPKDLAACGRNGHSLYFYAPVVDAMPRQHVSELIAHELAHVALFAVGEIQNVDRTIPRVFDETEIMADELMELWGIDSQAIDVWLEKYWTWKD